MTTRARLATFALALAATFGAAARAGAAVGPIGPAAPAAPVPTTGATTTGEHEMSEQIDQQAHEQTEADR